MAEMRHTDFMRGLKSLLPKQLDPALHTYQLGETQWLFQVYYGAEKRIHYEVSRVTVPQGRMLEIGLHFEARDATLNQHYLHYCQTHLLEIRHALGTPVVAEQWDRGWTKVYEAYPSPSLTAEVQLFTAERLAAFIGVIQPMMHHFAIP